jgi:uncharacterized membrane protein
MNNILELVLITLIPALELRASIPYGILKLNMGWPLVFIVCVIANIIIGPAVYFFLDNIMHLFLRIKWIKRIYDYYVKRTQKKIHESVEKYGELGLAIFIGIPLPGTGVYTGALAAYLLGMGYKKTIYATMIGVLIAAIIVTAVVLTGSGAFSFLIKMM